MPHLTSSFYHLGLRTLDKVIRPRAIYYRAAEDSLNSCRRASRLLQRTQPPPWIKMFEKSWSRLRRNAWHARPYVVSQRRLLLRKMTVTTAIFKQWWCASSTRSCWLNEWGSTEGVRVLLLLTTTRIIQAELCRRNHSQKFPLPRSTTRSTRNCWLRPKSLTNFLMWRERVSSDEYSLHRSTTASLSQFCNQRKTNIGNILDQGHKKIATSASRTLLKSLLCLSCSEAL